MRSFCLTTAFFLTASASFAASLDGAAFGPCLTANECFEVIQATQAPNTLFDDSAQIKATASTSANWDTDQLLTFGPQGWEEFFQPAREQAAVAVTFNVAIGTAVALTTFNAASFWGPKAPAATPLFDACAATMSSDDAFLATDAFLAAAPAATHPAQSSVTQSPSPIRFASAGLSPSGSIPSGSTPTQTQTTNARDPQPEPLTPVPLPAAALLLLTALGGLGLARQFRP